MQSRKRQAGFTLIELLVVIAVIALLMGILMPALNMAKKQGQAVRCLSNLKQIGLAMHIYAQENDMMIPRDETDGLWMILFMPYVGGQSDQVEHYADLDIYDCPSYPEKEQTVDYCSNAWDTESGNVVGKELRGATKIDVIPRHATTVYLADYEYIPDASHIQIVYRDESDAQALRNKLRWMDVYAAVHLPSSDTGRRVARERHGKGTNCLFVDGHADKLVSMEMTPWDWGLPRTDGTP